MKRCPKDADHWTHRTLQETCTAEILQARHNISWLSWRCTRPQNHKGKHHAHAGLKHCYKIWNDAEATLEEL